MSSGCWARRARGSAPHVITEHDAETGALLARNPWNHAFPGVAFARPRRPPDRMDLRSARIPRSPRHAGCARRAGPGGAVVRHARAPALDPCGALRCRFALEPGREHRVHLPVSGQAASAERGPQRCIMRTAQRRFRRAAGSTRAQWHELTDHVQVKTPDRAFDIMMNGWLLYQTLACRTWARAGVLPGERRLRFPRSAAGCDGAGRGAPGAVARADPACGRPAVPRGRRAALVAAAQRPGRAHAHLRRSRVAGRTSPRTTSQLTGDHAILDVELPFIEGPPLPRERHDAFFEPSLGDADRHACSNIAGADSRARSTWARTACR